MSLPTARSVSSGFYRSLNFRAKIRATKDRGILAVIAHGCRQKRKVRITYHKVTDGAIVVRVLECYSFRYEKSRLGPGRWKYLYAWHGRKKSIKKFLVNNILDAQLTRNYFIPKWPVEIG